VPLLQRDEAKRKPPAGQADQVGRDVNRWAWDGLSIAFPILEAGPAGWREVVTGIRPSSVVGTVTGGRDNRGQVVVSQSGSSGNYLEYADTPDHHSPTREITVVCRLRFNGTTATGAGIFGKVITSGAQASWAVFSADTIATLDGVLTTSGSPGGQNTDATATAPLSTTAYTNVFFRWRDGEILTVDVLKDGGASAGQSATSSGVVTGTITYTSGPMRIFGSDEVVGVGGDVSTLLVYARKLTDVECQALAVDPFLPFRRPVSGQRQASVVAGLQPLGYRPMSRRG
jgi:hypothetical protein